MREGFDFVVRIGSLGDSGLISKKIGEYTIVNCVSPSYVEKYGTPRTLEDLKNHYQVHYVQTLGSKPDAFEYFDGSRYVLHKTKSLVTVNSIDSYQAACLAGLGIVQVPLPGVEEELKVGNLKKVLTKYVAEPAPIHIIFPQRRHIPKRTRVCMDWVEGLIKGYVK